MILAHLSCGLRPVRATDSLGGGLFTLGRHGLIPLCLDLSLQRQRRCNINLGVTLSDILRRGFFFPDGAFQIRFRHHMRYNAIFYKLIAALSVITISFGQYAADLATVSALGTDPAMLSAPGVYGFDPLVYTPHNTPTNAAEAAALPTATMLDAAGASATTLGAGDLKYVYYDGLDYLENPTRVFACVGIPATASAANPVPAVVLVHGGGGSAYPTWVKKWRNRGYAAICIAVEGQVHRKDASFPQMNTNWNIHNMAGPVRAGIYNDTNVSPITDQWMYHATADAILANSLMRSLPVVDANKVGIMGISWGGVITSTAIGIDNRFSFAIPTYGCGHLFDASNNYGLNLSDDEAYKQVWDPMVRMANATMPVLWYSWPQDPHFPMDSFAYSYKAAGGARMVSLVNNMLHGHGAAWARQESYDFADSVVATGAPWCVQQSSNVSMGVRGTTVTVVFSSTKPLHSAAILTTVDHDDTTTDITVNQAWIETALATPVDNLDGTYTVTAPLPLGTTAWYINVEGAGLSGDSVVSSDYEEIFEVTLDSAPELAMTLAAGVTQTTGTASLSYTGPSNLPITNVVVSGQSNPGSFTLLTTAPTLLSEPSPVTTALDVQFDNAIAGLGAGQSATATLTVFWEKTDGTTEQVQLPLKATMAGTASTTVIYGVTANWSSQPVNCVDDVIIHNNATVTIDSLTACAVNLIVNDDPVPNTGSLVVTAPTTLDVSGSIVMGTDTGGGFITQTGGVVTTPVLEVNSSNTGSTSLYYLGGGDLVLEGTGGLDVGAGSFVVIDGGTASKDLATQSPDGALGDSLSSGTVQVRSGALQLLNGVVTSIVNHYGQLDITGGDVDVIGQFRVWSDIKVTGNAADVRVAWLNGLPGSHFTFALDSDGVSPIVVNDWMSLGSSLITVDGSSYTGGTATMVLMDSANLVGTASAGNISVAGFPIGYQAQVVQDVATDEVRLEIVETVYGSWATSHGLMGTDRDPAADADGDGQKNLYEFAFNGDPNDGSKGASVCCFDGGTFSATRRAAAVAGLVYVLQESTTLGGWTVVTGTSSTVASVSGDFETVEITKPAGWGSGAKHFLRLKVEMAP